MTASNQQFHHPAAVSATEAAAPRLPSRTTGSIRGALAVAVTLAAVSGCPRHSSPPTVTIRGISMAPTLHGRHGIATCPECRFELRFSPQQLPQSKQLVCPNCACDSLTAEPSDWRPGQQVRIHRTTNSDFQRWQLIAFHNPTTGACSVKRIVGLPGETISFQDGCVVADGQVQLPATPIEHLVFVFDAHHQPPADRLRPANESSRWKKKGSHWEYNGTATDAGEPDWLRYRHRRGYRHHPAGTRPRWIDDHYAINQQLSRTPHVVSDVSLHLTSTFWKPGALCIEIGNRYRMHSVCLEPFANRIQVDQQERDLFADRAITPGTTLDLRLQLRGGELMLGGTDGQRRFSLQFGQRSRTQLAKPAVEPKIRLAGRQGPITLKRFEIRRELYYYADGLQQSWKLGGDEFFVVGDNLPVSHDSRGWDHPGLQREQILGIVEP